MEITGTVALIGDLQTFESGFTKREVVIKVQSGKYEDDLCLELLKDNVGIADGLTVGDEITAQLNIRSREYNGRWFTSVVAWKVDGGSAEPQTAQATTEDEDEIPF